MMRPGIVALTLLLAAGCSAKSAREDAANVIVREGTIAAREQVSSDEARDNVNTRTSVYGSVSSGGRVSIGIGVMLSSILAGSSSSQPVRYEVEFDEDDSMTIYHDSPDFAVGDCVEIRVHPDEKKHPPAMKRVDCK